MEPREIKRRLKQYASACEKIVPMGKELRIQELMQMEMQHAKERKSLPQMKGLNAVTVSGTRGNVWNFIWEQIGYLGRYCLIWQAVWIVLFFYMMQYGVSFFFGESDGNGILVAVSILTPLLILLTVEEVTKVYHRSMLEIEYATKYSLRSAVMIRLSSLCVVHAILPVICIVCLHSHLESNVGRLLIYGFTPMVITTGVLLKLMQYCQGELLKSAAVGIYVMTAALVIVGNTKYLGWYQPEWFKAWCMVCAAGVVFVIRQFVCLNGKLSSYEQIVQYE